MNPSTPLEDRVTELEIKLSFQEDLVDKLDQVIVRQQQQIDQLVAAVVQLRERQPEQGAGVARNLRDELPPHY